MMKVRNKGVFVVFNAEKVILSTVAEYSTGASTHSTQAAPYTHARRNWLLFAKRQRGIFRLLWGVQTHS